jgi:hypothetical protein
MAMTTVEAPRNLPMVIAATGLGFVMVRAAGSIVNVALAQWEPVLVSRSRRLESSAIRETISK